jgi:hypothetical protein
MTLPKQQLVRKDRAQDRPYVPDDDSIQVSDFVRGVPVAVARVHDPPKRRLVRKDRAGQVRPYVPDDGSSAYSLGLWRWAQVAICLYPMDADSV